MAGAAVISNVPSRLESIFVTESKNDVGIYALKFFALGIPVNMVIDDFIPLTKFDYTLYANIPADGALWGPILEKGFAKFHSNYESIESGATGEAINELIGSPTIDYWHNKTDKDELWEKVLTQLSKDAMISSGSFTGTGSD